LVANGRLAPNGAPSSPQEEIRLLRLGRSALVADHASEALDWLQQARLLFPQGALAEERDLLLIQALAATGNRQSAVMMARGFEAAYPESVHLSHVRLMLSRMQ
jgi:hypothetical protein